MGVLHIFNPKPSLKERMLADFHLFMDEFKARGSLEALPADIALEKDEHAYLEAPAELYEKRSVPCPRSSVRAGFLVMNGVVVWRGGSGVAERAQRPRPTDEGVLTLTNRRFIFRGTTTNRAVPLSQIGAVEQFIDAIGISSTAGAKTLFFRDINPFIWKAVYEMVSQTGVFGSLIKNVREGEHTSRHRWFTVP